MAKSALITGASGLLGRQVLQAFQRAGWEAVGTGFTRAKPPTILKVDISDSTAIEQVLDKIPLVGAANRFPDKCEADPDGARAVNVESTRTLAQAASARGIFFIYISTDYLFSGAPGEAPYEVDSPTQPPNIYGQTKLDGEKATLEQTKDQGLGVVLRVPVLYGSAEEPDASSVNMLLDVLWKSQEKGSKIKMDDWAQRYPTNTEDAGRVCLDIAVKYLEAGDARTSLPRILQFSSEERFTKYEICELFADIMGLPLQGIIANKEGNDLNASVQRPYDTHLSTKALKDLGIDVRAQDFKAWWRREVKAFRR
ncbi:substrate binding domain-containing protein [Lasallia pustulata]|uniref:Substrate binding domain-containing protein n=1 Tax=Lasallia pustulata TaxID=136370 RepID=A0A1W5CVW7_9LECA|nr:substrate binding domain-containing protein [Lasallia pustulata]